MSTALRTSLIWHDEVMADVVHERPATVTLGTKSSATFVTPELALPPSFAIVTPGRRGYVLTLSATMSGTISLGGVEHDVRAFVAAGDEGSGFRGITLGTDDWGVVTLDASGDHKFFFQFVPHEVEDWNLGHPMILAGVGGYLMSVLALTLFWWHSGLAVGEAAFRGGSVASLAIGFAAIVRWAFKQNNESRASLAFSVLLHSAIMLLTFQLYEKQSPSVWPGPTSVASTYLVKASEQEAPKPEPKQKPTVDEKKQPTIGVALPLKRMNDPVQPSVDAWQHPPKETFKKDTKQGKKGDGLLGHTDMLTKVSKDRGMLDVLNNFNRIDDGGGETPEVGDGKGPHIKGGDKDGDPNAIKGRHKNSGKGIDTGDNRTADLCLGVCGGKGVPALEIQGGGGGGGGGGNDGLSKEDIAKVMGSRSGLFRMCYQNALDRGTSKGGDLVVKFVINSDGKVTSSNTVSGSIDGGVASCVKSKLTLLRFPKSGTGAIVTHFPFVFTSN